MSCDYPTLCLILDGLEGLYPSAVALIRKGLSQYRWQRFEEWRGEPRKVEWLGLSPGGYRMTFFGTPGDKDWPFPPGQEPQLWWCEPPPLPGEAKLQ